MFGKEITPYLTLSKKILLNRFLVCSCDLLEKKKQNHTLEYLEDLNMEMTLSGKKIKFHVFIKWLPQLVK